MSTATSFRPFETSHWQFQPWLKVHDYGMFSIAAILGFIIFYVSRHLTSPYRKLPPGPRGYPIIGNLLELRTEQWLKFSAWRKDYGDLIYLNAAGQPIVVLNSHRVATDLLDRRSAIYSDRPRHIVACDIMTGGLLFAFTGYGDVWRRMRRAVHEGFNKNSIQRFYETQTTEAVLLASNWLVEPAKWDQHFSRAAASLMLSVLYGYPSITSEQHHIVKGVNNCVGRLTQAAYPGAYLVEFFPWMRYIPSSLAKWKRYAEDCYEKDSAMFDGLLDTVEANFAKGDDYQSLCATLIREVERNKLSSRERSWLAATMYVGGADSTSVALAWWALAMLAHPETQARAHAELDAIVGRSRLPTFADYPSLPYIRAMVQEVVRWGTAAPLGLPHRSTEDDWYEGMFIPKGTICIPNSWQMNHDPEIYGENVARFDPARYLDANGEMTPGPLEGEQWNVSYGFGRRRCPASHVANNSLFVTIAITLWAAKIGRKKDESGGLLPLDTDGFVDQGIVVCPVPFECEVAPRFPEAPSLLSQERELRGL